MRKSNDENKNKFLDAAIKEITERGIADFSVRGVAERCNVSCGAPYKHFKSKTQLISAVIQYINEKWSEVLRKTVDLYGGDLRLMLVEICMAYISFLCSNPEYQTVLSINDRSIGDAIKYSKGQLSEITAELVHKYSNSVKMNPDDEVRKTYAVRSFIYGAALMINSGVMSFSSATLNMIRSVINREFDLS